MKAFFQSLFGDKKKKKRSNDPLTEEKDPNDTSKWNLSQGDDYWQNKKLPLHRRDRKIKIDVVQVLPRLCDVSVEERDALWIRKLRLCSFIFDFTKNEYLKEKELKRLTLNEILSYIKTTTLVCSPQVWEETIEMISTNLFRPLPTNSNKLRSERANMIYLEQFEDEDQFHDPAWVHLSVIYDLLFTIVAPYPNQGLKHLINANFVLQLLYTINSEDYRERDWAKATLHRIYGQFMSLRLFIRKSMNDVFLQFIYQTQQHNGIGDLLEIVSSIINGFALPLKEEHKNFLRKILIPLHSPFTLGQFHSQLSLCIQNLLAKDPTLTPEFLTGIFHYWPKTYSKKEVLFMDELGTILEKISNSYIVPIRIQLFQKLAHCISSNHYQVCMHALSIINQDSSFDLLNGDKQALFSILLPPLVKNSKSHWNVSIFDLSKMILIKLYEFDSDVFTLYFENEKIPLESLELDVTIKPVMPPPPPPPPQPTPIPAYENYTNIVTQDENVNDISRVRRDTFGQVMVDVTPVKSEINPPILETIQSGKFLVENEKYTEKSPIKEQTPSPDKIEQDKIEQDKIEQGNENTTVDNTTNDDNKSTENNNELKVVVNNLDDDDENLNVNLTEESLSPNDPSEQKLVSFDKVSTITIPKEDNDEEDDLPITEEEEEKPRDDCPEIVDDSPDNDDNDTDLPLSTVNKQINKVLLLNKIRKIDEYPDSPSLQIAKKYADDHDKLSESKLFGVNDDN